MGTVSLIIDLLMIFNSVSAQVQLRIQPTGTVKETNIIFANITQQQIISHLEITMYYLANKQTHYILLLQKEL